MEIYEEETSTTPTIEQYVSALDEMRIKWEELNSKYNASLNQYQIVLRQAEDAKRRHRKDIDRIGDALVEWVDANNVCDEYDELVDDLNNDLLFNLPKTSRDFTVTETWTVTRTMVVTARSDEDAMEMADDHRVSCVEDLSIDGWVIESFCRDDQQADEA